MDRISANYLIIQYPILANFIEEAFKRGNYEDIMNLLFNLETDDVVKFH